MRQEIDPLFLCSFDVHKHAIQSEYTLLKGACMLRDLPRFCGCLPARFALDHDIEVNKFFRDCRHVVFKTEGIFAHGVCRQNIISLAFTRTLNKDFVIWGSHFKIDIKSASGLNLYVGAL
jgi:hypothetical protein